MIYQMNRQRVDLVRDDYYQTEMAYQQQLDQMTNARHTTPITLAFESSDQTLTFSLPTALRTGTIYFYRPADRQLDFTIPIPAAHTNQQEVSTAGLARGPWRIKCTWTDGKRAFYTEETLIL